MCKNCILFLVSKAFAKKKKTVVREEGNNIREVLLILKDICL